MELIYIYFFFIYFNPHYSRFMYGIVEFASRISYSFDIKSLNVQAVVAHDLNTIDV